MGGLDSVVCAVTGYDVNALAVIMEPNSMQIHSHWGTSSHKTFISKIRPYGDDACYYTFNCTKPEGGANVLIRFVEYH